MPVRYELSAEEVEAMEGARVEEGGTTGEIPGFPKELWFKDDEDDTMPGLFTGARDVDDMREDDEDEDDNEDVELRASDAIFLCAKTEEDLSCVEMHVYDDEAGSLYVHHDVTLPAFPLALEWLRLPYGEAVTNNSFVAVGTFETQIEVWNLDVLDALEPTLTLGAASNDKKKKKKKDKTQEHTEAVSALSWNRLTLKTLASGSADRTVKLWDLAGSKCAASFEALGRVQTTVFHPKEAAALAYGGDDKRVRLRDCRALNTVTDFPLLDSDVECLAWHPLNPAHLAVSCENGTVACYDVRQASAPVWDLGKPHGSRSVPAIAFNEFGLFASASHDKTVQLFDLRPNKQQRLAARSMAVGKLFALAFDEGDPFLLAAAGAKATLALWDTPENDAVSAFQQETK